MNPRDEQIAKALELGQYAGHEILGSDRIHNVAMGLLAGYIADGWDGGVDALQYDPETYTQETIEAALTALGTTDTVRLTLRPGTWVISSNADWSAYTNVTFKIVPGAVISHGAFTVNIPNPDAKLYQIFSGAGIVTVSGNVQEVYPEWWGTASNTIISALASVNGRHIPIRLQEATYTFSSTLNITSSFTTIIGPTYPESAVAAVGATLEYTGASGIAMSVGVAPNINGTNIVGVHLEGFYLKVTENTDCALEIWHSLGGLFKRINIYGNSDNDQVADYEDVWNVISGNNHGLRVRGSIDTGFEQIDIQGQGIGNIAGPTKWLGYGIYLTAGFNNTINTTLRFINVYVHYCKTAIRNSQGCATFNDSIIEHLTIRGIYTQLGSYLTFNSLWAENCFKVAYNSGAELRFNDGRFDLYTQQTFFDHVAGVLTFNQVAFTSSHATPAIFDNGTYSGSSVRFTHCLFSDPAMTMTTIAGSGVGSWTTIKIVDMDVVIYRFIQKTIAANTQYNPMPVESGYAGANYIMPSKGHLLGCNAYYSAAYTAGIYRVYVLLDAVAKIDVTNLGANYRHNLNHLDYPFVAGAVLSAQIDYGLGFTIVGGDVIVEVIVALGEDGVTP
jgi:hypothetical protein